MHKSTFSSTGIEKEIQDNGNIVFHFTSQPSSTVTKFDDAAKYLNSLLAEGYVIVETEEDTSGDYATYSNNHEYVVFENNQFKKAGAPCADIGTRYDHEYIKYVLSKKELNDDTFFEPGTVISLLHTNSNFEVSSVERKITANLGTHISVEGLSYNIEIAKINLSLDYIFNKFKSDIYYIDAIYVKSPEFLSEFLDRFQERKIEILSKRNKSLEKSIQDNIEKMETPLKVIHKK